MKSINTPVNRILSGLLLFILVGPLLAGCWPASPTQQVESAAYLPATAAPAGELASTQAAVLPTATAAQAPAVEAIPIGTVTPQALPADEWRSAGEPAGCLAPGEQATWQEMLAYADRLLQMGQPLEKRLLTSSWNAAQQRFIHQDGLALTLAVAGLRLDPSLQKILNALHVAGFVAWLRETSDQQMHILAIPLLDTGWQEGNWAPYIQAYWQSRVSLPESDSDILPALKLPPCRWMVEAGFAPPVDARWWASDPAGWPDYASAVPAYLADDTAAANQIAGRIDWLGPRGSEAATTMCGPLVWAVMQDAGAFPPGVGGWSSGPKSFWLSKPSVNGRPWSLFPSESYSVYHFDWPLGRFDFSAWPLYPGDFLYTYSAGDGFDHMVVVTEVDEDGNIYVVTNRVWEYPEPKLTIERVVFVSLQDPAVGIAKNEWHADRLNGRTGHAGFDVFRWAWMEKDIQQKPVRSIVQPGDTFDLVAARWRTPAEQIARYNGMAVDSDLTIGQELMIPPNENIVR